ncbi:MAG: hypothetical protein ABIE55_01025 [Candidatus Aenigmatarchaeota archaeon]
MRVRDYFHPLRLREKVEELETECKMRPTKSVYLRKDALVAFEAIYGLAVLPVSIPCYFKRFLVSSTKDKFRENITSSLLGKGFSEEQISENLEI